MDLGTSIAIFLVLALVLLTLFCLVTKYFNYRMRKAQEDSNEIYSMIDDFQNEGAAQGEYDEFVRRRELERTGHRAVEGMIEMATLGSGMQPNASNLLGLGSKETGRSEVREPLGIGADIYGLSMLRRRLNGEVIPMRQESNRSISSLRSFRPEKINTQRSAAEQSKEELKD